jgi:hypothetical protein
VADGRTPSTTDRSRALTVSSWFFASRTRPKVGKSAVRRGRPVDNSALWTTPAAARPP